MNSSSYSSSQYFRPVQLLFQISLYWNTLDNVFYELLMKSNELCDNLVLITASALLLMHLLLLQRFVCYQKNKWNVIDIWPHSSEDPSFSSINGSISEFSTTKWPCWIIRCCKMSPLVSAVFAHNLKWTNPQMKKIAFNVIESRWRNYCNQY